MNAALSVLGMIMPFFADRAWWSHGNVGGIPYGQGVVMGGSYGADAVLIVHFAYVVFVVSGFLLIPLGVWRGWRWTRGVRYRVLHSAAIGYVAFEQVFHITCPLTLWEYRLRGGAGAPHAFVPRLLQTVLFHGWPRPVFTGLYLGLVAWALFYWWRWPPDHD